MEADTLDTHRIQRTNIVLIEGCLFSRIHRTHIGYREHTLNNKTHIHTHTHYTIRHTYTHTHIKQ